VDAYLLALLADACLRLGRLAEAADVLEAALATRPRERTFFYEAELHRLHGELLAAAGGDERAAEESVRRALAVAGEAGALSLQLRAALSLVRLPAQPRRDAEARALVTELYDRFTEGYETADLLEARALVRTVRA
jgi:adenylate cyclase